jgi:hypothetical protein
VRREVMGLELLLQADCCLIAAHEVLIDLE